MKKRKIVFMSILILLAVSSYFGLVFAYPLMYYSTTSRIEYFEEKWGVDISFVSKVEFRAAETAMDGSTTYNVFKCETAPDDGFFSSAAQGVQKEDFEKRLSGLTSRLNVYFQGSDKKFLPDFSKAYQYKMMQPASNSGSAKAYFMYIPELNRLITAVDIG